MSTLAQALLAILTLSVVAGGVGLVSTSDESPVDRSRPVIIGRVGNVDDDRARGGDDRSRGDQPRDDQPQEDPAPSPSVVIPKPRDLTPGDDLDASEDGDDTDEGEDGQDDDSEDHDDDDAGEGGDD